jgi:hypothetical protein
VWSLSFPCHTVAHPHSVMPYTCNILASGCSLSYNCRCMPSVAQQPPTNIDLKDEREAGSADLPSAGNSGGTATVLAILYFATAARKPVSSYRGIM